MSTENITPKFFTRNLELEGCCAPLKLVQKEVGDTSCVVWDASVVLAKYLEMESIRRDNKVWLNGKVVVELGSGVGCAGLTAACYGADVALTDLPEVVSLLWANVDVNRFVWDANGGRVEVRELAWGKDSTTDWPSPDIILLADCVYYDQSLQPLVTTLEGLAQEKTEIIICQELRDTSKQKEFWEQFLKLIKEKFIVENIPQNEQHSLFSSGDIVLMKAKKLAESL